MMHRNLHPGTHLACCSARSYPRCRTLLSNIQLHGGHVSGEYRRALNQGMGSNRRKAIIMWNFGWTIYYHVELWLDHLSLQIIRGPWLLMWVLELLSDESGARR
mmetsp:Transcript_3447/g.9952  ORF Transcript_3447/g.9952 Transcript_3447/m.9952 type:complete len:104 (-) Transcript_3447:310-621(-)